MKSMGNELSYNLTIWNICYSYISIKRKHMVFAERIEMNITVVTRGAFEQDEKLQNRFFQVMGK